MRAGKTVLVIGYGNLLRSDDGAGAFVVERLNELGIPGIETRILQQLNVELAEELNRYDTVLLIDASEEGPPVQLKKVESTGTPASLSHHLRPDLLLALMGRLYPMPPEMYVCTVLGECFDFGSNLSEPARRRAEEAVRKIIEFLRR